MKSAESKTNTTTSHLPQARQVSQPFFRKDGEGSFFSKEASQTEFFFNQKPIQAKLTIGAPNDPYEQEADAMAEKVVQRLALDGGPTGSPAVQMKCAACEEEEKVQKKEGEEEEVMPKLQKKAVFESNEEPPKEAVQMKSSVGPSEASPDLESSLSASRGGGQPLPEGTRSSMESAFGADFSGVRVHTGNEAVQMNMELGAQAFTHGSDVYFGAGKYDAGSTEGQRLLGHELTHVVQQGMISPSKQRSPIVQRVPDDKKKFVPHEVHVDKQMTKEEFKVVAMQQIFGGVAEGVKWNNLKDSYGPDRSPVTVNVQIDLLKRNRSEVNKDRGMSTDDGGGITGAKERAEIFHTGPGTDEKSALMDEIDHRYFEAVGDETKTKIKPEEKAKAELWRTIRDEVLFQHEYIANLPPKVKMLIKQSIQGKVLTPSDYDQLFRIAKKIEAMPLSQATDYASKVTGTTTDLNQFEASLKSYSTEMAKRQGETEAHKDTMTKLAGLKQVYEKYKRWVEIESIAPGANQTERAELEKLLKAHDFAGIPEFQQYIDKFLKGFEMESAGIIQDLLAKYDGRLYREGERYKNPQEVSALHGKLGGYRSNLDEMKQAEDVMQAEYAKQGDARERSRLPGHGGTTPEPTEAFKAAQKKGEGAREAARGELRNLATEHPIFQDDEALPVDRRINKIALHTATETSLQGVLLGFIAQRKEAVKDARGELAGNSELIWKMDKMIPQFMLQQGIVDGSIHAQIIQDKMREDRIKKIVMGILAAIAAIALTVVSLGTATPAIVAAGAAAGAFGISAYMAYEEVKNYVQDKNLADVGLVDDPSIIWVVVAIAGAALDAGAAVKAIRAIGPLARTVNAGGDLVTFNKAVRAFEESGEIDAKIARAAEHAAAAKKGYQEASSELGRVLGSKFYGGFGPFTDPDVYKALVKMAAAKFKEIGNNGLIFIEEIKKARALAKLGDMTPEELAKVKQAWAEGKALAVAEETFDDWIKQFPRKKTPNNTPRDAYEIQHTGPENIELRGGGEKIWADGVRSTDAHLLEAKFVENPASSPFIPGSKCPQFIRDKIVAEVNEEFRRYGAILNDSNTPAKALEVITNDQQAVPFFQDLLTKYNIPGQIVVKPK
jgi:Domain of unknown function (DUF4157)